MCGITGYVGPRPAWPIVLSGLKRLEYRGYDSAGIATVDRNLLRLAKQVGHLSALERAYPNGLEGIAGIGHTRWATHGRVSVENCHPHFDPENSVAVVHNGIIDNADRLRKWLESEGYVFRSETDSEVLAHLISRSMNNGAAGDLAEAVRAALQKIEGTAGLLALSWRQPDHIVAARIGSPVVIGIGDGESFVASDANALVGYTRRIVYLDDGEVADITPTSLNTTDLDNQSRRKKVEEIQFEADDIQLNGHPHFMLKEIMEQPVVVDRTARGRTNASEATSRLGGLTDLGPQMFAFKRFVLFGCGTSLHAAEVGQYLFERYARLPASAEDAAELRSRNPIVRPDTLHVAITQSGETADTLSTLREVKMRGGTVIGITNAVGSTVSRETDCGVYIHAGPEISVASTKAFTAQVTALTLMALRFARMHDMSSQEGRRWVESFEALPEQMHQMLAHASLIEDIARTFARASYLMFVGRGVSYPLAKEGALKLKEIAYIPCDGLSGAGMKHGSLALVQPGTPVWAIVPPDEVRERMVGNLQELNARGARIIAIADPGDEEVRRLSQAIIPLPDHHPAFSPALSVIPLQLFAYYVARELGYDVDKPRNLAKSVTVE
jgi:glutamine---fructose-6-phosphate transaminase (isomerizing)